MARHSIATRGAMCGAGVARSWRLPLASREHCAYSVRYGRHRAETHSRTPRDHSRRRRKRARRTVRRIPRALHLDVPRAALARRGATLRRWRDRVPTHPPNEARDPVITSKGSKRAGCGLNTRGNPPGRTSDRGLRASSRRRPARFFETLRLGIRVIDTALAFADCTQVSRANARRAALEVLARELDLDRDDVVAVAGTTSWPFPPPGERTP